MSGIDVSNLLDIDGAAAPALSAATTARMYLDSTKLQLLLSSFGSAYQYMLADTMYWGTAVPTINSFLSPYKAAIAASELAGQVSMPRDGHIAGLFVRALNANFSAGGTITVRKGGVNTALAVTFTNAVNSIADDADIIAVSRGDLISMQTSVALTNTFVWASFLLLP